MLKFNKGGEKMKKILLFIFITTMLLTLKASNNNIYSSLVIDAKGLNLKRSKSPKILSEKGYEVYGTIFENLEKALEMGVFFYTPNLEKAKKYAPKRVGNNPLIIKAKEISGATKSDVVVKDEDALKILKENKKSHFLDNFKVIVLID